MKDTPSQAPARMPGRLGSAEARLDAALDRLDAALGGQAEGTAGLARHMTRMQEENAALRLTRDEVSGRLDAAVERLRQVLAH